MKLSIETTDANAYSVRLSPAAQAILKQDTVSVTPNATANIVHAVRFR